MENAGDRYSASVDRELALDLAAIEQQIEQLWHPRARGDDPITSLATRASVLNLIIYVPDSVAEERIIEITERLSNVHPCRVILFRRVPDDGHESPGLDIYSVCEATDGQPGVPCIERIRIPVTQQRYRQLIHLAQPLIIPELPAVFWWPADPALTDAAFMAMAMGSNLTIVDSLNFSSAWQLRDLAGLENQLPSRAALADLNWQRLQPWRALTAQYFDIPALNWSLSCIHDVEIEVGSIDDRMLPAQALMFASWLAHGLGWKPFEARRTRNDRWYIGMRDQSGEHVRTIIRTRPAHGEGRGHLLALSISAQNEERQQSNLTLTRGGGSSLIRMRALSEPDTRMHHAVPHPVLADDALLKPVLEAPIRDQIFGGSLHKAAEILEQFARPEAT